MGEEARLTDDTRPGTSAGSAGRGLSPLSGACERLGDLEEGKAEFEESALDEGLLGGGEIAGGLLVENAEHVDALACAEDVYLRLLTLFGATAELEDGLHVDGLHDLLEVHGGGMVGTGIGGANGYVEAIGGRLEGEPRLLHLLRRGCGRE